MNNLDQMVVFSKALVGVRRGLPESEREWSSLDHDILDAIHRGFVGTYIAANSAYDGGQCLRQEFIIADIKSSSVEWQRK